MTPKLKVKKLSEDAIIPTRGSEKASGLDLYALEDTTILPGETKLVRTGIAFQIPEGYEVQVRARSGLSLKTGFRVANGIGTVDQDYLGECCVIGWNSNLTPLDDTSITYGSIQFKKGDRIAQAILCPVVLPELEEVTEFNVETERSTGGFGSTGV